VVGVAVNSVVIQVILVVIGGEERSGHCRRLSGGIGEQSGSRDQVRARAQYPGVRVHWQADVFRAGRDGRTGAVDGRSGGLR
jgi:hypothetical protein